MCVCVCFSLRQAREGYFQALFGILLIVTTYRFVGSFIYVSYTWHKKLAHARTKLKYWLAYLRKPPYPRHLYHDGYKPRVFYNSSYNRQYNSTHRVKTSCVFSDESLETQKLTRSFCFPPFQNDVSDYTCPKIFCVRILFVSPFRVVVPIVMQSVLDRNDVDLQWYAQTENLRAHEKQELLRVEERLAV